MQSPYHRKKQPQLIRRTLLDCAAALALEQGLAGVSLQAVAKATGVTKGGLLHHFPNRRALVEGVVSDLLQRTEAILDALMARDPHPRGRFTRAYVEMTFADPVPGEGQEWTALCLSMVAEPSVGRIWGEWLAGRLERHRATDHGAVFEIVRLAADGAWLAHLMREEGGRTTGIEALRLRLIAMTRDD
ncbi:TetR/AcrR family transcriptional regulator [Methylorubrum extorquens]|uniref:HTH tetR-type domain-containing protein n=1 Tax=Methylorubrum extorquens (strain ATCC 14718 / DSM 1338 / JCM 2805 / NCIMB 9133 / AM1) TaxID=272630 RepID=C5ATK0_METEA|nr:TetR/AcrR family transcriptional regulator [Methylorubrum extorquens]ACS40524.1 conserved hypothetical protein [Methylorubrum extorquens AM1]MCP1586140.1 AcrR family transcriptional regulator [Methylorubrum extorquens]